MPSERRGTVTDDIAGYIQRLHGTSEWRADRTGNIRTPIAAVCFLYHAAFFQLKTCQMNFPIEDVVRNVRHFLASVKRATGNTKEEDKKSKNTSKPGGYIIIVICALFICFFPSHYNQQGYAQL